MSNFKYSGDELDVFAFAVNWKKYWSRLIVQYIGINVVEFGAGIGSTYHLFSSLKHDSWLAIEPDSCFYEKLGALENSTYHPRLGTSNNIELNEKFDTALYIDVLEHIEDDVAELKRAADSLNTGGHIIIVSPAHQFLYTKFDAKIGHYRRYDRHNLISIVPANCQVIDCKYIDSAGIVASFANKFLLKSGEPTLSQIKFWDTYLVRVSRVLDRLFMHKLGKTIVLILQKK